MSAGAVHRLIPLTFGWEDVPETISIHGGDPSVRFREPVPGVLVLTDDGWLLLDTGFNDPLLRDPWLHRRFAHADIHSELLPGETDSLLVAFQAAGVDPADVSMVALSHLHNDHVGGLRHFADRVPVHLQRRELEYGQRPHPEPARHGIFRIHFDDPVIDWRPIDGDAEIAPGVEAIATYGHTWGHQSFVVTFDEELAGRCGIPGVVLAFDAADLQRNLDEELAVGGFIDCEPGQTVDAIRRLKQIGLERGYPVIPGHDPIGWPAFTGQMAGDVSRR